MPDLPIDSTRSIPQRELQVAFARAGGPGGQNVNKVETKVELRWWPAATSLRLSPEERVHLLARLAPRLTDDGALVVTSSEERSQARNRARAEGKLAAIVRAALLRPAVRRPTSVPRRAKTRRLAAKRRVGEKKRSRRISGEE